MPGHLDQLRALDRNRYALRSVSCVAQDPEEFKWLVTPSVYTDGKVLEDRVVVFDDRDTRFVHIMQGPDFSPLLMDVSVPTLSGIIIPDHSTPELIGVERISGLIVEQL